MDWLDITIFGMHLIHWLLSGLIPFVLIALTIAWLLLGFRLRINAVRLITPLVDAIDDLEGRSMDHLHQVREIFAGSPEPAFGESLAAMEKASRELYQSRWLPDPARYLKADRLFSPAQSDAISLRPAARILAVGILGSLTSLLAQSQIAPPTGILRAGLSLLPVLTALACALLLAALAGKTGQFLKSLQEDLQCSLADRLPVFNDQAGLALLIDNFMIYDRQMKSTLQDFTATAGRLADGDMVEGIRRSVEQVMLGSVAPPIQQAAATLGSLAGELANRQDRGMQELASQFANALASDLAGHLKPVNKEIDLMRALMTDVKNYIEYAMRALETTRQQSEGLLSETLGALRQMAEARGQLTADFARVDGQIRIIAESTSHMAGLYSGADQGLAGSIGLFGDQLDQYSQQMKMMLAEAVQAMQTATACAKDQQDSAGLYLSAMQDQVNNLSSRLGADIQNLLARVHQETETVAGHTAAIAGQLASLNTTLDRSLNDFSQSSAGYVKKTLSEFDSGLAELTVRMAQTADEIRDAVDALPAALHQAQGQSPHFER